MENMEKGLGKVAGGQVIESEGEFCVVPNDVLWFETRAEAEAAAKMEAHLMKKIHKYCDMHDKCHKEFDKSAGMDK